jgi:hypothetical protein
MNTKHKSLHALMPLFFISVLSFGLSFRTNLNSPVKGSVNPPDGAIRAWLLSKSDTLNSPVIQGNFMITNVRPGNYLLMMEGKPPYKDNFKQDVLVVDGQPTDVGVIEMHQ